MNLILSKRIGKLSSLLVYTLLGIPILFVTSHAALSFFGYFPDGVGWDVAEKIVAKKGNVIDCRKIIGFSILPLPGPSIREQRASCIYEYAKLTKDPSACELLMPSSYGLSCVGGAIAARKICNLNEDSVSWWENEKEKIVSKVSFESCQRDDRSSSLKRNQCCLIARVTRVKNQNDCSSLSRYPELHDECMAGMAFKNRDPNACSKILNANLRSACTVRTKAMKQNSSICSGCREPVNNLSELQ